jgi:hypothetical protein
MLDSVANALGLHLPPWAGPLALLAILAVCWPLIRTNLHTENARKLLKRASRERGAERERLEAEALAMVGDRPDGLVVVAREAVEQGRTALAERAVVKLRATGKNLPDLRRLERAIEPPLAGTPAEVCIVIERMLEAGMVEQARARYAQARRKWPFDDELDAIEPHVTAGRAVAAAPAPTAPVPSRE